MGHFEFDFKIADLISLMATSGDKHIDGYLTRPGKAVFEIMVHIFDNHPYMSDQELLLAIRPAAYQQLVNEMT